MQVTERLLDLPFIGNREALRSFIIAGWLGWQIESNWADPLLFAIYSILRPMAAVLILVVMYSVVTDGALTEPIFAYIYLGNAFYILVGQVITGVSWVVIDDREHYRTMRQLHTTPVDGYSYLLGRGVARLFVAGVSVFIVVVLGKILFKLPVSLATVNWPLFLLAIFVGIVSLAAVGLILGAATMMMARHYWSVGEAVAGALFLFSGAVFPLDILPSFLRPIGYIFPVSYWLELTRRAMLGKQAVLFPTFERFSNGELLSILLAFCLALILVSTIFYRRALHRAKESGLIDMETSY